MVFPSILADEPKQLLKLRHFDDAVATKCVQPILGEAPLSHVGNDSASQIVSGNSTVGERTGGDSSDNGPECILLADGAGDDLLVIHFLLGKEIFGQVGTMEHDSFVQI